MLAEKNTVTISDLRKNTLMVLERMEGSEEPLTIFSNSKPVGVIMSLQVYDKLQQDADLTFAAEDYSSAWDFLINPPESIRIKKKGLSAVELIRKERD